MPDPTVIVSVDEPAPGAAIEVGLKLAVVPAGRPDADNAIAELKLPDKDVVIAEAPELPRTIVKAEGDDAIAKSAGGPPDVVTFNAKSSTRKEVFRPESSDPIK